MSYRRLADKKEDVMPCGGGSPYGRVLSDEFAVGNMTVEKHGEVVRLVNRTSGVVIELKTTEDGRGIALEIVRATSLIRVSQRELIVD